MFGYSIPDSPMSIPSIPAFQPTQYQPTFVRMYILALMLDNLLLIPMSIQKYSNKTKYWAKQTNWEMCQSNWPIKKKEGQN